MYTSLHVHYEKGSVGDSILKTTKAIEKAKKIGMKALAITDHGSMANVINFYKECNKNGIKPIIGCEVYEVKDRLVKEDRKMNHLILLAKNKQGYKDLLHITADAQFKGYYYKGRTDLNILKEYGQNIIGLSACLGGRIPQLILKILKAINGEMLNDEVDSIEGYINNVYREIIELIEEYKQCFSDFYLELQPGNFEEQISINKLLVDLARETNTKLVITNDVHYLNSEDWMAHDQHVKMSRKQKYDDPMIYPDKSYYLMGYDAIKNMFQYLPQDIVEEAIANTNKIADEINLEDLYDGKIKMPKADVPINYTEEDYLAKVTLDKLEQIKDKLKDPSTYYERAEYELKTLREVGYCGYLLVIKDIYDYAYSNDIPLGPGRGSISGSLVAWLIGITKVDPIKYNLLFERFVSIHRKGSVPDVDVDCASSKRQLLFDYVVSKYGKENCALVSTFMIRKARSAIKDTARIFDIDIDYANKVSKLIPQVYYNDEDGEKLTDISIEEALEISEELRSIKSENEEWFKAAMDLENLASTTSIHAAGTLISPEPLETYVPLIKGKDEMIATALNLSDAEFAGAIKYDFLGLSTIDITNSTEKDIGGKYDFNDDIWLHDEATWKLIGSRRTATLFQISSKTYQQRMCRLKPKTIEDLAACLALVRGPCISSKLDEQYMQIVEGKRQVELLHPFYDEATKETNGIILYQEQLMQVLVNWGFTLEESFVTMKAAAKKKQDVLAADESKFKQLGVANNISDNVINRIWDIILDMGKYSFNKSHAISYALLCYYSAFLKTHYTLYWMKNALKYVFTKKGKAEVRKKAIQEVVQECRALGIKFLGLDINKSEWDFIIEDNALRIGFVALKGLGEAAFEALKLARSENGIFNSIEDVTNCISTKFNKKAFLVAIFGGAFDYCCDRNESYNEYCNIRDEDTLDIIKVSKDLSFKRNDSILELEDSLFDVSLLSNPVQYLNEFNLYKQKQNSIFNLQAIVRSVKKTKDRNGGKMAFMTLETTSGYVDSVVFSEAYNKNTKYMRNNTVISIKGKRSKDSIIITEFVA